MAIITGTTSSDILTGTDGDDTFLPYGIANGQAPDRMSGGDGADTYDLREATGSDPLHRYIIDDNGTDGATDRIDNAGALVHIASFGYIGFATALRDGDDLVIVTPYKPSRFRDPSKPAYEITIVDHYAGEAVEIMVAGGISYQLATGSGGGRAADIMAGTNLDDVLFGRGGNDFMTGNDGNDTLVGGGGDDYLFGGTGDDTLKAGTGDDRIHAGTGNDIAKAGAGADRLYLQDGDDIGRGGAGADYIYGQDGNDRLVGGAGQDVLSGGRGDDVMVGGTGGDTYRYGYDVDASSSMDLAGHDVINDKGDAAGHDNFDRIQLFGYYGPSDASSGAAFARLAFARNGNDMVMTSDGATGSITVRNQFGGDRFAVEELHFFAGYWTPLRFKILDGARVDIGDDRTNQWSEGGEWNEVLFATGADDQVFGDSGTNFIWLGEGADRLIYKESDPGLLANGAGGGAVNDIVMDFALGDDVMDFTEMKITMADLTVVDNAAGNATVNWYSDIPWEVANIHIELRGIAAAELTADHFVL